MSGVYICVGYWDIPWDIARMLAANLCAVCFVCYDWSMCVLVFSARLGWGGAVLPVALDGSGWVSSLSVALDVVGVCCVLLLHLCNLVLVLFGDGSFFLIGLGNTFFFSCVGTKAPLAVKMPWGNTFDCYQCSTKLVRLKVCYRFYLMSFYLWLL